MKARWNNMTTRDRIINVLIIILSVAVIALAVLQLLGIWKALGCPFGLGATMPGALVCLILLVTVSLATYKKSPSIMPDTSKTA